jgi:N-acetylmuramic acid 6-phosphate etherase
VGKLLVIWSVRARNDGNSSCTELQCKMVDLRVSNVKLQARGRRIIRTVNKEGVYMPSSSALDTEPSDDTLDSLIARCDGSVKLAIIVGRTGWSIQRACIELEAHQGVLARVLDTTTFSESNVPLSTEIFNLCVDGGGTSTKVLLSSATGNILARGSSGSSNVSTDGIEGSLRSVQSALIMALGTLSPPVPLSRVRFGRAWVGHAGLDRRLRPTVYYAYVKKIEAFLGLQLDHNLKVTSDAQLLTASLMARPQKQGVVLIAGTGSISMLFLQKDGSPDDLELIRREGGLGYLLGDEGSAYSIGRQAIRHALSQSYPNSKELSKEVMEYLNVTSTEGLIPLVYKDASLSKSVIASVAPVVLASAGKGNICADAILQEAVDDLTNMVLRVLSGTNGNDMAVCVTGGITGSEAFRRAFVLRMGQKNAAVVVNIHWIDDPVLVACQSLAQG